MRNVVLLCGPPGAGKTTAAHASGLPVFDRDDPRWPDEQSFRRDLARLAFDPQARAVVIRSGATSSARGRAAELVMATQVFVLLLPRDELMRRISIRARHDAKQTKAAVDTWFTRFERHDGVPDFPGWEQATTPDLGVAGAW